MRAWRGSERLQARAALKSWLYRIANNVCLDMLQGSQRRAQPMDLGPSSAADARARRRAARARMGSADTGRARAGARGRPGPGRRGARDAPPRVRGGAAAAAAAAARGADPARGAALAGERGRRAAGDVGGVGQQRAAARAGDARGARPGRRRPGLGRRGAAGAAGALRRGVRALRHRRARLDPARGRDVLDAAVPALAPRPGGGRPLHARPGHPLQGLAAADDVGQRRAGGRRLPPGRAGRVRAVGDRRARAVRRADRRPAPLPLSRAVRPVRPSARGSRPSTSASPTSSSSSRSSSDTLPSRNRPPWRRATSWKRTRASTSARSARPGPTRPTTCSAPSAPTITTVVELSPGPATVLLRSMSLRRSGRAELIGAGRG